MMTFLLVTILTLLTCQTSNVLAEEPQKPNILLFLVDDMGWQDTSVPFHSEVTPLNKKFHTPHMEQLAKEGMKFTQAYVSSICSPTRVSLVTGLNVARHRVSNWTLRKNASNDRRHSQLAFPGWNVNGLSPVAGIERTIHATPLPKVLQEAGYWTIHVGKAHFGAIGTPGADPLNLGFNVNIAGHAAGGPGSYLGTQNFSAAFRKGDRIWDIPGLEKYHGKDIFLTEALTLEANAAVSKAVAMKKPFFLYLAHYAVHVPFAADKRFHQKYVDAGLPPKEAMYAALVEGMDDSLGEVRKHLKKLGVADNTVILFLSDNGGLSIAGRDGKRNTHNAPLSSGKGSAHEGGVRVPMLASWKGVIKPGTTCDKYVLVEDFFPTILEIAGVKNFKQVGTNNATPMNVDGISFLSLLEGKSDTWDATRPLFWHCPNNWGPRGPGIGPTSSVRQGDWKLIYYYETKKFELFNIAEDIGETQNLATAQPERVKTLAAILRKHLRDVKATLPVDKKTNKPVPLPGE